VAVVAVGGVARYYEPIPGTTHSPFDGDTISNISLLKGRSTNNGCRILHAPSICTHYDISNSKAAMIMIDLMVDTERAEPLPVLAHTSYR